MAAGFTSYIVDNDRKFRDALRRAKSEIADLTIPLKQISADFYKSERSIFQLQGPGQYPDLSPRYKLAKQKAVGFLYPILKRSGRLSKSVLSQDAPDAIWEIVRKQSLIIGTRTPWGVFHQSDEPRSKIPLRKFLFIGPEALRSATRETSGRAERWLNILNGFVLAKAGIVGETAGVKIKVSPEGQVST